MVKRSVIGLGSGANWEHYVRLDSLDNLNPPRNRNVELFDYRFRDDLKEFHRQALSTLRCRGWAYYRAYLAAPKTGRRMPASEFVAQGKLNLPRGSGNPEDSACGGGVDRGRRKSEIRRVGGVEQLASELEELALQRREALR